MQKKNVAIMIHKLYGGGAEKVAANLSTYLPDEKYNKKVITYDSRNIGYTFSGEIIDLKSGVSKTSLGKLINFIKRVHKTKKLKKQKKIDVTISLLSGPNLVNLLSRKNDKAILSVRSFLSTSRFNFYNRLHKFLIRKLYNKADLIVAVSKEIKKDLINNFGIKEDIIRVINNFYDIDEITKLSEDLVGKNQNLFNFPTVITSGRLSEQKGQWHLIRAFKRVKEKVPNAKLIILGKGDLKGYLVNLSRELGIEDDVHFLGFQANPFKYLSKADIYAFPSLYEGFPNALCEAMACELPVISSDCSSGPREILSPSLVNKDISMKRVHYTEFGILIPPDTGEKYDAYTSLTRSEHLLSDAITEVFINKDKMNKYGVLSKQRINEFDKENLIKQWENILDY